MNSQTLRLGLAALAVAALGSGCATTGGTARDLAARHKDALVQVSCVLKIEGIPGQSGPGEQPLDTIGTVIGADGLTVMSATAINPISILQGMDTDPGGGGQSSIKSSQSNLKIRLADGTEIPATLIMQDDDLDLAFVIPETRKEGAAPFAYVPFDGGAAAQIMDPVIGIGQLGKMFNWEISAGLNHVMARTTKPRTFYALAPGYTGGLGTPVFTACGQPLGILVLRNQPGARRPTGMAVVVPATDVMELAAQARAAAAKRKDTKDKADAAKNGTTAAPASATPAKP